MSPSERGRRHKSCLDDFDDHRAILSNALGAFPQQLQFRTRPRPTKPRPMARCAPALVAAMACGAAVVSSATCRRAAFLIGAAAGTPPDTRFLGAVATGPFRPSSASSFPPPALALCIIQDPNWIFYVRFRAHRRWRARGGRIALTERCTSKCAALLVLGGASARLSIRRFLW